MRIAKEDVPVKVDASPGAVARQQTDFGDATGFGPIGAEHYRIAAGTDLSPLLQGLEDNLCQAPHWGYLIEGELTVSFKDGTEDNPRSGDLFTCRRGTRYEPKRTLRWSFSALDMSTPRFWTISTGCSAADQWFQVRSSAGVWSQT